MSRGLTPLPLGDMSRGLTPLPLRDMSRGLTPLPLADMSAAGVRAPARAARASRAYTAQVGA